MRDPQRYPEDFAAFSPSRFGQIVGLRLSIVNELIQRNEVRHFKDKDGKLRIWMDVSNWCAHPQQAIDWSQTYKPAAPSGVYLGGAEDAEIR